jgi:hypothetical protein
MPSVAAVVPWRAGCPHREAAWRWTRTRIGVEFPDWRVVEADHDGVPYSKAEAVMRAVAALSADVVVVHDADVWCSDTGNALKQVARGFAWAVPHDVVCRLTEDATAAVLAGGEIDNRESEEIHRAMLAGGIVVARRDVFDVAPLDVRFRGWGGEDFAWGRALRTLVGEPWRARSPLTHLWHPPAPRLSRAVGSEETGQLMTRYLTADRNPAQMGVLVDEARDVFSALG